jgi:hypothetical protein
MGKSCKNEERSRYTQYEGTLWDMVRKQLCRSIVVETHHSLPGLVARPIEEGR